MSEQRIEHPDDRDEAEETDQLEDLDRLDEPEVDLFDQLDSEEGDTRPTKRLPPAWQPPLVALVGRPNVGKSTLFNRLVGHRTAITYDTPGVTRDRHYALAHIGPHLVQLIDTGGFAPGETEGMLPLMREQAQIAIEEADAILFITCAREGLLPGDEEIADVLRRTKKPVFLCANKADAPSLDADAMAMYALGFDEVWPIAAEHNRGVLDVLEALVEALQERGAFEHEPDHGDKPEQEYIRGGYVDRVRVCFVGKPNVGKSTMINKLLGHERVICADQPGTTRDSIDVEFTWKDSPFTLVDTAGLRRKRAIHDLVEQYAVSQAVRAIERAHIAVLVLDATDKLSDQDSKIGALVQDRGRGCVVAINKWDIAPNKDSTLAQLYEQDLERIVPFLAHCPKVFLSAKTGQRLDRLFDTVERVFLNFNRRVPTHQFNKWLIALQERVQPPTYRGRKLRMYYGAQLSVRPPRFVIQVNFLDAISPAYQRFLVAQIREAWDFEGVPIRLELRKKPPRKAKRGDDRGVPGVAQAEEDFWLSIDGEQPPEITDDDEDDGDAETETPALSGEWHDDDLLIERGKTTAPGDHDEDDW